MHDLRLSAQILIGFFPVNAGLSYAKHIKVWAVYYKYFHFVCLSIILFAISSAVPSTLRTQSAVERYMG